MNQRTKNRINEHSNHESFVKVKSVPFVVALGGPGELWECSCGWTGWLDVTIEKVERDRTT